MTNKQAKTTAPRKASPRPQGASAAAARGRKAPAAKAAPEDAFGAAKAILLKGRKLDMVALAAQLGVGRATLYRWTGDRERLIADVLAQCQDETFQWLDQLVAKKRLRGAARIATEIEAMMRVLTQSKAVRGLLKNEPDTALRILMSFAPGSLRARSMERLLAAIEHERANGRYTPRAEPRLLALAAIRVVGSYVYGSTIAGMDIDLQEAGQVIRILL